MYVSETKNLETATFANGCYWCTEAVFKRVKGVISVMSGYTGGTMENPTYSDVASKTTGHAEALQIQFDPSVISYGIILDIFWATHDPTTLNQQGYDVGPEYRSAIFYHDAEQKKIAENSKKRLDESEKYKNPIVTEIVPYKKFYPAEEEHRNFYESGNRPDYCRVIIDPKIRKLLAEFENDVKEEYKENN
ncbi:MAG: peptide-methionine (S)-S-oxide reductase MsrA [Candidatus Levyibacteriota bacterium]